MTETTQETTAVQTGEFHVSNGLTVRRNYDGTVTVRQYTDARCEIVAHEHKLTEWEWESVLHSTQWGAVHRRPADHP